MDSIIQGRQRLGNLPYTNCRTQVITLKDLDIPEAASDAHYRQIYQNYISRANTDPNASLLLSAIDSIKYGISPPVAFPTETVYGLGADATNEPAIAGIFAAKGRPSDNPLIVHVSSVEHLERVTEAPLPEIYKSLADKFLPGPLTILLPVPKVSKFAKNVHPGQSTIGFRIPSSKYARFFIAACDRPIAGPSANSSGKPSPTTAQHVLDDLRGKINFILDAGPCDVGVESTVVDGLHDPPLILRPGGVSQSELIAHGKQFGNLFSNTDIGYKRYEDSSPSYTPPSPPSPSNPSTPNSSGSTLTLAGKYDQLLNGAPRAPGMKYRHYAPQGRMTLFSPQAVLNGRVQAKFDQIIKSSQGKTVRVGFVSCHWPPFAGISTSQYPLSSHPSSCPSETTPISHSQLPSPPSSEPIPQTPYSSITQTMTLSLPNNTSITLYNMQLGNDISVLAQSLFGVLRLFDDLQCGYIFAETVRRTPTPLTNNYGQEEDENRENVGSGSKEESGVKMRDLEDAVRDRIEKAAGERVDE